jgi:predicted nucleic acid-binding protein
VTRLDAALGGVTRLGLDTSPVIYLIERHPRYAALVATIFREMLDHGRRGVTSFITLTEVLVQPIRRMDAELANTYRRFLIYSDYLDVVPITESAAVLAAAMRASYGLKLPDALQLAVAREAGCEAFLTNDLTLRRVTELRILVLDDLEP